jgi:hypothetical protein
MSGNLLITRCASYSRSLNRRRKLRPILPVLQSQKNWKNFAPKNDGEKDQFPLKEQHRNNEADLSRKVSQEIHKGVRLARVTPPPDWGVVETRGVEHTRIDSGKVLPAAIALRCNCFLTYFFERNYGAGRDCQDIPIENNHTPPTMRTMPATRAI